MSMKTWELGEKKTRKLERSRLTSTQGALMWKLSYKETAWLATENSSAASKKNPFSFVQMYAFCLIFFMQ